MAYFAGNIPETLTFISSGCEEIGWTWEDIDEESDARRKAVVTPAFISDAGNEKTIATGIKWANSRRRKTGKAYPDR
jgi:hypothetical protein